MQMVMKRVNQKSKGDQRMIEQVVLSFANTRLDHLHCTSPSIIGVLDTTDPLDPTFRLLDSNSQIYFQSVPIENNVFSIVDKLIQIFINKYKNESWKFCHDTPFVMPDTLRIIYPGKTSHIRRLWRNEKHSSHGIDKKDPPENHITVTQTGHLIDELLFDLEVPYILTWGDETSEASAERVRKENNGNGRIPDCRLRIVMQKKQVEIMVIESCRKGADENKILNDREKMIRMLKDAYERLERELINYTTTNITSDIEKQFNNIDLFAIQSIGYSKFILFTFNSVNGIFYRLQKFAVVTIPFSPSQAKNVENFILTLLKFRLAIDRSATNIANINENVRKNRKDLYSVISNTTKHNHILPKYITPNTPPRS
ncbi:hypothetical protein RclHR1_11130008 [Rhizophagus clarus]|uniref:Uncharacterized protein n=1 Tax=Rhizophagus clarus TaxID=94130 RepID=A0A2Z6QIH8_9GLOM|nr:hypothetical protein RclHR1_11130008 [Rhizophagus clarus]GES81667.1 hypothetical protein GLOIN_2v1762192 [Rhizophagus clarus]